MFLKAEFEGLKTSPRIIACWMALPEYVLPLGASFACVKFLYVGLTDAKNWLVPQIVYLLFACSMG
jgi:hypothetical protein